MADSRFFKCKGPFSLKMVADTGECTIASNGADLAVQILDLNTLFAAQKGQLAVFNNTKYKSQLLETSADTILTEEKFLPHIPQDKNVLVARSSQKAYALIASLFYPDALNAVDLGYCGVHPDAKIGQNVSIGAYASIGADVSIGDNCVIGANVVVGSGCMIGNNCHIHASVTISHSIIGNGVVVYSGAQIGGAGFGFYMGHDGFVSVPQIGRVRIGDYAHIGSNTCIDRGAIDDTIIGMMTRIDNLVQIAHSVQIGAGSVIVSQTGIAGSTKIGQHCAIGGQTGITGHLNIGDGVQIASGSGVMKDLADKSIVGGRPAVAIRQWKKQVIILQKLSNKERI